MYVDFLYLSFFSSIRRLFSFSRIFVLVRIHWTSVYVVFHLIYFVVVYLAVDLGQYFLLEIFSFFFVFIVFCVFLVNVSSSFQQRRNLSTVTVLLITFNNRCNVINEIFSCLFYFSFFASFFSQKRNNKSFVHW